MFVTVTPSAHADGSSAPPQPPRAGERLLAGAAGRRCRGAQAGREDPGVGWQFLGGTGADGAEVEGGRGVGGHLGAPDNDEGSN
jgi:hypothetical protein